MNLRKSLTAVSIATVMGLGAIGQAHASIYGSAFLDMQNLLINITEPGGTNPTTNTSFVFSSNNLVDLNGSAPVATSGACNSVATCGGAGAVLDPLAAQIGINAGENNYSYQGPGLNEYSRADSIITNAQLVTGVPTATTNIAESELQTGFLANSSSDIQSNTGLVFTFTVSGPGTITFSAEFDVDLRAAINDPNAVFGSSATANTSVQVKFTENATGDNVTWNPTTVKGLGACGGDAIQTGASVTCNQDQVSQNLNNAVSTNLTPNSNDQFSWNDNNFQPYFLSLNFTNAGTYSLALTDNKNVQLSRVAIPEPSTLLLLGMGMAGLGFAKRRLRKG